jgi:hypothetical protein
MTLLLSLLRGVLDAVIIVVAAMAAIAALYRPWFLRSLVIGWRLDQLQRRHARRVGAEPGDALWRAYSDAFFACRRTLGPHTWDEFRDAWRAVSRARKALRDGRAAGPNFRRGPSTESSRGGAR